MSSTVFEQRLPYPIADVWRIHATPGIVTRLTPGFARVSILQEASNLKSGLTRMHFPGGLVWEGKHDPTYYQPLGQSDQHQNQPAQFSDVCETIGAGKAMGWRHVHSFFSDPADALGSTVLRDSISTHAPTPVANRLLAGIFGYRQAQLTGDLAHLQQAKEWPGPTTESMTIAVTGATGLVGTQLCALLQLAGHRVIQLSRTAAKQQDSADARPGGAPVEYRQWDPFHPDSDLLSGVDAVVHLAGGSIIGRFTHNHLLGVERSRVEPTRLLAELAAQTESVHTFVSASAVGLYGPHRPEPSDEDAPADIESALGGVVKNWEDATLPAQEAGLRVSMIRTGLVLAGGSPLLDLLTASAKFGGGAVGTGSQHFPWIGINDLVDIYHRALIDPLVHGPINAVAPGIVTNAEMMATLAEVGGNPLIPAAWRSKLQIPVPAAAPKLLLGENGAEELALADQHIVPGALTRLEHKFRTPNLRATLQHELGKLPARALRS